MEIIKNTTKFELFCEHSNSIFATYVVEHIFIIQNSWEPEILQKIMSPFPYFRKTSILTHFRSFCPICGLVDPLCSSKYGFRLCHIVMISIINHSQ